MNGARECARQRSRGGADVVRSIIAVTFALILLTGTSVMADEQNGEKLQDTTNQESPADSVPASGNPQRAEKLEDAPQQDSLTDSVSNFVRIVKFPETLVQRGKVVVEYYCEEDSVIVVDLIVMLVDTDKYFTVYSKAWRCHGQDLEGKPRLKSVRLRLVDTLTYRPDYFLKASTIWQVSSCKLRAWLVSETTWSMDQSEDVFLSSKSRDIHKVLVLPPYSRPYKKSACTVWIWPYIQKLIKFSDFQICPMEAEFVTLLNYPAVFSGKPHGILKEFSAFRDPALERDRLQKRYYAQLTVEMWVYILEYCPLHHLSPAAACGLFIHMDGRGTFLNPALVITKDGNIQIDMRGAGGFIAMKSMETVPKNVWTRIVFSFNHKRVTHYVCGGAKTWVLSVNHGPDMSFGFWTSYTYNENMYVDDTEGIINIGGVDWTMGSFVGYVGRVRYHRQKALSPEQLSLPDQFHPMFQLHLTGRQEKCYHFLSWLDSAVSVFQNYRRFKIGQREDICPNEPLIFFTRWLNLSHVLLTCPPKYPYNLHHHRRVSRLLWKAVLAHNLSKNFLDGVLETYSRNFETDGQATLHNISTSLFDSTKSTVTQKGLRGASKVVYLLKQAACLGNDDAMFTLAVMLNNGVGVAPDEIQSLAFFMLGALNRHLLSMMALGHRHVMGIDGAPVDRDVAYMYYKQVADMTRVDKEVHKESGIATETIRLIDEAKIEEQTTEVGDLFLWLKNQAERGVASAQTTLGAMLYHGAGGVNRNLQNAINVFRDGAEMGNAEAMFNYGIMQYRGLGAKADRTEGKRILQKAADMNNPSAVSALGWVALEIDKNYTQAFEMFLEAKKLDHMDSGYYLGFMYQFGLVPNHTVDLDKAIEEYHWSAKKQQIDAGTVYAFLLSRGTPRYRRNIDLAVEWARFIAEKNANLAKPLREALNAFRDGNYDLALYLYMMLADTGLEVATFNVAYLCELNKDGVKSLISKDCEWRHYNLSTQRESQFVDPYSNIKMGDFYWYGCLGHRNLQEAARHYSQAALKGNPQALFNLAYMVEEGVKISPVIWWMLHLTPEIYSNRVNLLLELYSRCRESRQSEAFIPCCLAWFRVWCLDVWDQYYVYMKITSFLGILVTVATSAFIMYRYFLQWLADRKVEEERRIQEEEEERHEREDTQDI